MIKIIGDEYRIYGLIIVKIAKKITNLDYELSNTTFELPNDTFAQSPNVSKNVSSFLFREY
jgi:hypothetical protein